jgi:valyl-tRNA synthetase
VADDYVDPEFGSGAVKVTPGHDPNDFAIGQRHNLEVISIIGEDARMTEAAGPYAGLDRYECRKQVVEDLKAGAVEKMTNMIIPLVAVSAAALWLNHLFHVSGLLK